MKPTYSSLATLHSGSSKHLQNTGDTLPIDQCIISKKTVIFINNALKTTTCCRTAKTALLQSSIIHETQKPMKLHGRQQNSVYDKKNQRMLMAYVKNDL